MIMTNQQLTRLLKDFKLARVMLESSTRSQEIRDMFDANNTLIDALQFVGPFELLKDGQVSATVKSILSVPSPSLAFALFHADEIRVIQ